MENKCTEVINYGGNTATEYYDLRNPNSERAILEAEDLGLDVVFPKSNELQLDIDTEEDFQQFLKLQDIVVYHFGLSCVQVTPSRSGLPKRHVTLTTTQSWTDTERILVQACLGSDRTRELLSYLQVLQGDPHPVLFLENPPYFDQALVERATVTFPNGEDDIGNFLLDGDILF